MGDDIFDNEMKFEDLQSSVQYFSDDSCVVLKFMLDKKNQSER